MAGREGVRDTIKHLREELKKTTDEKRRGEIKQKIDDLRTGRVCLLCGPPELWDRNHPITAGKPKTPEETDEELTAGYRESELVEGLKKLEEELAKTKDPKRRKALKKGISLLKKPEPLVVEVCGPPPPSVRNRPITGRKPKRKSKKKED